MSKILVVDDETDLEILVRQKFRKKIKTKEYEFIFATDGNEALDKIAEHPNVDIVLSDINMPGMDGLTLLSKLHEIAPLTKTVMVSAYGDMANIRTAMNRGAFDFVVKPVDFTDLEMTMEKTLQHVRQLKATLQAVKENNILKMYVDENVLNFMDSREFEASLTANETIEATVIFIDICSFTTISEKESPDMVVKILNQYFDIMVKAIIEQGGQVDKFIGDSVMAIFKGDTHLQRAIKSGLAVKSQIQLFQNSTSNTPENPLEVSIGVNSGEMVSGNIGAASLKRLDYTVIGDAVNMAQRLQAAAAPNQILITEAIYRKVEAIFTCRKIGKITVKNKVQPIVVFEVVS